MGKAVTALTRDGRIRLLNRLLRHIDIVLDERGCWEWRASSVHNGYGKVSVGGKMQLAHRVLYELVKGPVPAGLELDHLCRNRGCVKPAHLEPVTRAENVRRGLAPHTPNGNARKTTCPRGHPYDAANTYLVTYRTGPRRRCLVCVREQNRAAQRRRREKRRLDCG